MPAAIRRLRQRADFVRVAKTRQKFSTPGLVLQVRQQPGGGGDERSRSEAAVRVGFTVSKKVGNAVERNRVRRRLRAVVTEVLPAYARAGRDYVVIGRRGALTRAYADLKRDLELALGRTDDVTADAKGTGR